MKQIEMIEKYLEGKMTLTEKLAFEQNLRENEELRSAFLKVSSLIEGIEHVGRKEALEQLQQLEATMADNAPSINRNGVFYSSRFSMAAAVVAVLVVMGSFFVINNSQTEPSALFESNFAPYMNNVNSMSRSVSGEFNQRDLAFAAYDNYNFAEAAKYFNELLSVEEDASLLLYGGNAELGLGDAKSAIAKLTNLFENYDNFDNQAAWYLSLAHLKENNGMEAAGYLMFLMTTENSYSEKAATLFATLDLANLDPPGNNGYPPEKAVVYDVRQDDVPNGVEEEFSLNLENLQAASKGKFVQYGVVIADSDGEPLYFVNNPELVNLKIGSSVLVKRIPGKGSTVGTAVIISVL
jgi:tetratricopeptide (TPR) repeat protein